jgi:hypothetical protein
MLQVVSCLTPTPEDYYFKVGCFGKTIELRFKSMIIPILPGLSDPSFEHKVLISG